MDNLTFLHNTNIIVHVSTGTIALLLGIIALNVKKGGKTHRKSGRIFIILLAIVVITGLFGVIIFDVNSFLLVLTLLSGYNGYSGFRVLHNKSNTPKGLDIIIALITLFSGIYYLYYIKSIGMIWSPIIIYSTIGALFLTITYDLVRYAIPVKKYTNLWLYEHIYKMIAAFTALLAAATGTIYPDYKPYSQFLPSVFGTLLALGFILYFYRRNRRSKNEIIPKGI